MSVFHAVILGIVQGLSEFLPISSSGHLVLLQRIFGIEEEVMIFDVFLHVGTLVPVLIVYWKDIAELIKKPFQKMTYLLVLGTIPAVIVTLLFDDLIEELFSGGIFLAFGFIITGILLILSDRMTGGEKRKKDITYMDALLIGCVQGIAITPGISRSGSTITGSLARGLNKRTAAKFSFLLSIPVIVGAVVLQLKGLLTGNASIEAIGYLPMLAGFIASMISGYIAIRFMLALITKRKLKYFSIYLFLLAAFIMFDALVTKNFIV